jgi:hypothetical protein
MLRNLVASVRHRLLELARKRGEDFQIVLTHYAIERLIYRLSCSDHRDQFILKGAMLFQVWPDQPHRPTRDLDLLGKGEPSLERVARVFREVCEVPVQDDGLSFTAASVNAERIREDQIYEGVRVKCLAHLGQARIDLQIDVGFGDAVVPRPIKVIYPALLDFPAPTIRAYRWPTVVAEKFQAMVALGIANSRMKDFFDLWLLANNMSFDGPGLCRAIQATFRRRKTPLPMEPPLALTPAFGTDVSKVKQWEAFVKRGKLHVGDVTLEQVCTILNRFLLPPAKAFAAREPFPALWPPAGPWSEPPG